MTLLSILPDAHRSRFLGGRDIGKDCGEGGECSEIRKIIHDTKGRNYTRYRGRLFIEMEIRTLRGGRMSVLKY